MTIFVACWHRAARGRARPSSRTLSDALTSTPCLTPGHHKLNPWDCGRSDCASGQPDAPRSSIVMTYQKVKIRVPHSVNQGPAIIAWYKLRMLTNFLSLQRVCTSVESHTWPVVWFIPPTANGQRPKMTIFVILRASFSLTAKQINK